MNIIYRIFLKRIVDLVLAGLGLIILMPIFLIIGIAIKIDSKGPMIYTQKRVGKDGEEFKIYKFRSMLTFENSYYEDGTKMENYDRITKVGDILRKTSLDELPQIINILIGDMSIVGPRPTLPYQVERYNNRQAKRLTVKPGLTGLAQVNGRNNLTWEEKIEYDIEYLENISFIKDITIIIKTFFVLFKTEKVEFKQQDKISKHDNDLKEDVNN